PAVVGHRAHPAEIGAGAEGLAMAAEHNRAQRGVGAERRKGLCELGDDLVVERVAHIRPVEEDARHRAVARDVEGAGFTHVGRASSCSRYTMSSSGQRQPIEVSAALIWPRWCVPWLNTCASVAAKGSDTAVPRSVV